MMKEGRKKEASEVMQTTKQSNIAHPRQSLVHVVSHTIYCRNLRLEMKYCTISRLSSFTYLFGSMWSPIVEQLLSICALFGDVEDVNVVFS